MALDIRNVPWEYRNEYGWRYYKGVSGIGGYTVKRDPDGWFYSFFCKRAGKNARDETKRPEYYVYVPRLTGKRRGKKAVMQRSRNLAYGQDFSSHPIEEPKASEKRPGTGYCMKQKKTVFVDFNEEITAKNGRKMIRGSCPECATKIQKYGTLVQCGNCGNYREAKTDDYLCRWCREEIDG
jgi:hypothetical protein